MNCSLLAALLLFACADIVQADESADAVSVRQPLLKFVRRADVEPTCGVRGVAACTGFVGQRIDCACEMKGDAWRINAHAQFIPVMVLSDATWVSHEREHIGDVREALEAHLVVLETFAFDSQKTCELESARQTSGFGELMDRFKLESNAARHPRFAKLIGARK